VRKYVQTIKGPLFVAGKSKVCNSPDCSHYGHHYHASKVLRISLPRSTYGLDVLAFIGWQHEHEHKQFAEIQEKLSRRRIEVSERHVGRLYRQFLALLGGMNASVKNKLDETAKEHGGLIWTPVAGIQVDHPTADDLVTWLKPYQALPYEVLATLSDGEKAIIAALERCWPDAPRQRCQEHFLGNLAEPVLKMDDEVRQWMRNELGGLPAVPTEPETPAVEDSDRQSTSPPFCLTRQSSGMQG
jgi:hypothetical protein